MSTMSDLDIKMQNVLSMIPENQRAAASTILAQYGPTLLNMAVQDAWAMLRRLMAGDFQAIVDLDAQLSTDEFLAKVKANTAMWENVANYNKVRNDLKNEILLRIVPIVASILAALVGL